MNELSHRSPGGRWHDPQTQALAPIRSAAVAVNRPVPAIGWRSLDSRAMAAPRWVVTRLRDEWWVVVIACALALAAYAWFDAQGVTHAFNDARLREMIARRVLVSRTPGLAQFGTTWLPLGSILMLPFIWNDALFRSGIAGSIPSMLAFVVASLYMYRLGRMLTSSRAGGWVAAMALMFNPSVLYIQSTAMSETASMTALIAAVFYTAQLFRTYYAADVVKAASAAAAGTLIRYENWMIAAALVPLLAYVGWRHRGYLLAEAWTILYAMLAFVGCAGWVMYNAVIFHDPLASFFYGSSTHSFYFPQEVAPGRHRPVVAFAMYATTIAGTVGWMVAIAALAGLVLFVWRFRSRLHALPGYLLLVPFLFYWTVLVAGANTERLPGFGLGNLGYYNVRFGLLMVPAVGLFAGALVARLPRMLRTASVSTAPALILLSGLVSVAPGPSFDQPVTVALEMPFVEREAVAGAGAGGWQIGQAEAQWMSRQYHGGSILLTYPTDPSLMFYLMTRYGFADSVFITDANGPEFGAALRHPEDSVEWVVINSDPRNNADQVWLVLHGRDDFKRHFVLRNTYGTVQIYQRSA